MKSKRQNNYLEAYKKGRELAFINIEKLIRNKLPVIARTKRSRRSKSSFSKGTQKGVHAVGGSIADRLAKAWKTRRQKYGQSGRHKFSWDTAVGGKYYARRYYKQGSLGRRHAVGKGGGFRRKVHT